MDFPKKNVETILSSVYYFGNGGIRTFSSEAKAVQYNKHLNRVFNDAVEALEELWDLK